MATGPVPTALPFREGTLTWRVAREPIVGIAATPTLLLQVAHPLVAAGVKQYSDFETNPFGRLWRTLDITLKLAFGEPAVSARQERILEKMHERVRGTSAEGVPYEARDPELLLWVWATLAHGALDAYERIFVRLSDAERDRYIKEQQLIAHASGVPEGMCPESYEAFRSYLDRMIAEELRPTETSDSVIRLGVRPPVAWPLRSVAGRLNAVTIGLLPQRLRDDLLASAGRSWTGSDERALRRVLALVRGVVRVTPRRLRHLPTAYLVSRKKPLRLFERSSARRTARSAG